MDIQAIVTDVDGTLLNSAKNISPATQQAIIKAQKQGLRVILASGRPLQGMLKFARQLHLDEYGGYLISYNGSRITDYATGETLFNQPLPHEKALQILKHVKNYEVTPMISDDQFMYVNRADNNEIHRPSGTSVACHEAQSTNMALREVDDLESFLSFPINKILIAGEADYLQENLQDIYAPFKDELTGTLSSPRYFEITDKNVDKATALSRVLPLLGIPLDQVIAFGDGHNDRSLIQAVGIGVAMGNAVDELKEVADEITLDNNNDGIVAALNRHLALSG